MPVRALAPLRLDSAADGQAGQRQPERERY
jgi:hypothetical protein